MSDAPREPANAALEARAQRSDQIDRRRRRLRPHLERPEALERWSDEIRQLRGSRLQEERDRATIRAPATNGPRISGHVKPAVVPLKPRAIDILRRDDKWPPDLAVVDMLVVSLLADLEDPTQWSEAVSSAVAVWRAAHAEYRQRLRDHPDAKEQLDAGRWMRKEQLIHRFVLRMRKKPNDSTDASDTLAQQKEMRDVAERQQMLALDQRERRDDLARLGGGPRRRGRRPKPPEVRSVIDGWHWHDGRPNKFDVPLLLLRVEVWRDVRAQVRRDVLFAPALAEVLVADLRASDPTTYERVDELRRQHEEHEGCSPTRALTYAVNELIGPEFRKLQTRVSEARQRYTPPQRSSQPWPHVRVR